MSNKYLKALSLVLLAGFITTANQSDNYGVPVDSYILSVQYKPYHCKSITNDFCKNKDQPKWVIHGLFPNNLEKGLVTYCPARPFAFDKLKPSMKEQLEKYWANYSDQKNKDVHKHHWEKHGSCLDFKNVKTDKEEYFYNKALQLRNEYNLDFIEKKTIDLMSLNSQISKKYNGRKVHIICNKDDANERQQFIDEIKFLFDKNFKLIDYLKKDNCQRSLLIRLGD
jgi:ribonuclease I